MQKAKVLVVDDEALNVDILVNLLADAFEVKVAYNGHQALKVAAKLPIDVMLLDINMPKMSGFEVAKALRCDEKTAGIKIIFLTGDASEETIATARELGIDDYLIKPVDKTLLHQTILKCLS